MACGLELAVDEIRKGWEIKTESILLSFPRFEGCLLVLTMIVVEVIKLYATEDKLVSNSLSETSDIPVSKDRCLILNLFSSDLLISHGVWFNLLSEIIFGEFDFFREQSIVLPWHFSLNGLDDFRLVEFG